ncbi:MAG: SDR family oxidoreductase [Bacteroidota bacterium]
MNKNYFSDKVVLITGGASGIGRELCFQLGHKGAKVIVADINTELSSDLIDRLKDHKINSGYHNLDVSNYEAFESLLKNIVQNHGSIDIVINNAGVACAGEVRDLSIEKWRQVMKVNLEGVINGSVASYKEMCLQGYGQIVNIASMAGLTAFPISVPYGTSKFAVVGLTKSLRLEGKGLGIKVNTICPGYIDTPLLANTEIINADRDTFLSKIPFKLITVEKAVQIILKGVEKNKAQLIFPRYARVLNKLGHFFPGLLEWQLSKSVKDFRAIRQLKN